MQVVTTPRQNAYLLAQPCRPATGHFLPLSMRVTLARAERHRLLQVVRRRHQGQQQRRQDLLPRPQGILLPLRVCKQVCNNEARAEWPRLLRAPIVGRVCMPHAERLTRALSRARAFRWTSCRRSGVNRCASTCSPAQRALRVVHVVSFWPKPCAEPRPVHAHASADLSEEGDRADGDRLSAHHHLLPDFDLGRDPV